MNTQVTAKAETLGTRILLELARRKCTGTFFTYRQRIEIRRIDDRGDLRKTLAKWGFGKVDTAGTEAEILDAIGHAVTPSPKTMLLLGLLDIVLWGLPTSIFYIVEFARRFSRPGDPGL